jgi:DNA anti-recombination protein RmuC
VRDLVSTVRVELASARERLAAMVEASTERRDSAEELWRRLYQELAAKVSEQTEERAERLARIATASAEALEAATVVIESALERLEDDDHDAS